MELFISCYTLVLHGGSAQGRPVGIWDYIVLLNSMLAGYCLGKGLTLDIYTGVTSTSPCGKRVDANIESKLERVDANIESKLDILLP